MYQDGDVFAGTSLSVSGFLKKEEALFEVLCIGLLQAWEEVDSCVGGVMHALRPCKISGNLSHFSSTTKCRNNRRKGSCCFCSGRRCIFIFTFFFLIASPAFGTHRLGHTGVD